MRSLTKQVLEKLAETTFGDIDDKNKGLKLPPSKVGEIQDLLQTFERLTTRKESADERLRKIETQMSSLKSQRKKLATPANVDSLKAAIHTVQGVGPIESQHSELLLGIENKKEALEIALKRLPLWTDSPEKINTIQRPATESVNYFEEALTASKRRIDKLEDESQTVAREISQVQADLGAIRLAHEIPAEFDLDRARAVRGDGWRLVRLTLEGRTPPAEDINAFTRQFGEGLILPDGFERSVDQADHIADRLRREAEQVSRKSELETRKHQLENNQQALEKKLADTPNKQTAKQTKTKKNNKTKKKKPKTKTNNNKKQKKK